MPSALPPNGNPFGYLNCLSPEDEECLRSLGKKPGKLVHQYVLNLVCLFYLDADPYTVHTRLDQNLLVLVSRHYQRIEKDLR